MKTIQIRVEGGVVQEVTIPKEYEHLIDYEIIDLDTEELKEDGDAVKADKPLAGNVYALTGGPGTKCIANGNTWADSLVREDT
jgi:hypothetical protein|tara:strand:+ start:749 stop:997 length:249 start_codon:yes stop_codon:yes gene_type:complete